ncbi:MAG: VOC family protein [Deltaproteobacteria bacterium]|nr:VOC family protein [Deltaproteobacteria bacterium]
MNTPNENPAISGIHHITAVAASAADNYRFYTRVLGLRLVKKTVNFDDPFTYHLYYGDETGRPGTILTFFPWEQLPRGKPGTGMVSAIAFAVPRFSIDYWNRRLNEYGIAVDTESRFGEPVIRFNDPHGLPLELIGTPASADLNSDGAVLRTAIMGFHSATLLLDRIDATEKIIVEGMGMTPVLREGSRYRFAMQDDNAPGHLLDVRVDPSAGRGRPGGGTVHHIAFRTRDNREQLSWRQRIRQHGLSVTDVRDRKYFQSIYFHEPGGVLFEIATDPPGFAVDEDPRHLGTTLKLPHQYEALRGQIEEQLPPLELTDFRHVYLPPEPGAKHGDSIVALHGTGGNEHDLIPVVRQISLSAPVISLRGNVLENGMPRFFKRLAEGMFDENDVRYHAHHLSDFLAEAARCYGPMDNHRIALGYSNGANMAAAIMLLRPDVFSRAILFRPMMPLKMTPGPDLACKSILITTGRFDRVIPSAETQRLVHTLKKAGASVEVVDMDAGHELTAGDIEAARSWLGRGPGRRCATTPSRIKNAA